MAAKHFLTLSDVGPDNLRRLLARAIELKEMHRTGKHHTPLLGKVLAMIFEKASTRTRLSFETGMVQLGGHAIFLSPNDSQIGRGEPVADTARVLSRMVDIIMIRTFEHEKAEELARYSSVPVINALTDRFHPCQLLADIQTYLEHRGEIRGRTVAWIGDGNNMCNSFIEAAQLFDFRLNIACPDGYEPPAELVKAAGDRVSIVREPMEAAINADLLVTDVWSSMGMEKEKQARTKAFAGFQINGRVMAAAKPDALFMHCLPAHRGEEVSAEVIDGPQSVVWDEAGNRLHAQKALLEYLLSEK